MLYLLPNLLSEDLNWQDFFPSSTMQVVRTLEYLIAESEKSAHRYLRYFLKRDEKKPEIYLLNEHTKENEIFDLVKQIKTKKRGGLISDCGLPCIADPGAKLVFLLQQSNITIQALAGPSSIIMALMLSGLSGQNFCFNGYLPRKEQFLKEQLKKLEKDSFKQNKTHIWIETPYRTKKMLEIMLSVLKGNTLICVAQNLTTKKEKVITLSVAKWKKVKEQVQKGPAVFLIQAK